MYTKFPAPVRYSVLFVVIKVVMDVIFVSCALLGIAVAALREPMRDLLASFVPWFVPWETEDLPLFIVMYGFGLFSAAVFLHGLRNENARHTRVGLALLLAHVLTSGAPVAAVALLFFLHPRAWPYLTSNE